MPNINAAGTVQDQLNRASPAMADGKVGDVLAELITAVNALQTKYNALLAKLDADAGVTDANYAATQAVSTTSLKDLENRY